MPGSIYTIALHAMPWVLADAPFLSSNSDGWCSNNPDEKRLDAARRRRNEAVQWRGRLGDLASRLMSEQHPAALEVRF